MNTTSPNNAAQPTAQPNTPAPSESVETDRPTETSITLALPPTGLAARIDPRIRSVLTILLAVLISLFIIAVTVYFQSELRAIGRAGLIGLFIISAISNATVIVPAPVSIVFSCAVAPIYGPIPVGVASGLGSALGELTGYFVGRSGNSIIPKGKLYKRLRIYMRRRGWLVIFLLSAVPNPIFDVGGMIAGALKMPVWRFLLASGVGKTLRFCVTALICMGGLPWLERLFLR